MIVVDPRVTKTAMMADLHLPVRPRTDIALLNGMLHVLIDEGLVDLDYVDAHTDGLRRAARPTSPRYDARAGGGRVRRRPAGADPAGGPGLSAGPSGCVLAWTMGVNHSVQGTETVTLLNTLACSPATSARPGAAPFSITGQCNAMGTREAGFTASMPGYRAYDDAGRPGRAGRPVGHRRRPAARRRGAGPTRTSSTRS